MWISPYQMNCILPWKWCLNYYLSTFGPRIKYIKVLPWYNSIKNNSCQGKKNYLPIRHENLNSDSLNLCEKWYIPAVCVMVRWDVVIGGSLMFMGLLAIGQWDSQPKKWQRITENKHLRLYSDLHRCASTCAHTDTLPTLTHVFTNALKNAVLFPL